MQLKDLLDRWARGEVEPPAVTRLIGIRLIDHGEGTGSVEMDVEPRHYNAMGTLHGGILCDLADVAMGVAMATALEQTETFTTLNLQMSYFRQIKGGRLTANGRIVRRGRTTSYCECDILDHDDALVAKAGSSCLIAAGFR